MYLLDSNHCSRILEGDEALVSRIWSLRDEFVSISVIVHSELMYMALNSDRRCTNLPTIMEYLQTVVTLRTDNPVADRFAENKTAIFIRWGPRSRTVRRRTTLAQLGFSDNDLWIAATAVRHALRLVSSDGDFRRIPQVIDLTVDDWHVPGPAMGET